MQMFDDVGELCRRRIPALAGHIEMRVVAEQRDIGGDHDGDRRAAMSARRSARRKDAIRPPRSGSRIASMNSVSSVSVQATNKRLLEDRR